VVGEKLQNAAIKQSLTNAAESVNRDDGYPISVRSRHFQWRRKGHKQLELDWLYARALKMIHMDKRCEHESNYFAQV
jgi:hypothetical protein